MWILVTAITQQRGLLSLYGQPIFFWLLVLACLFTTGIVVFVIVKDWRQIRKSVFISSTHMLKEPQLGPILTEARKRGKQISKAAPVLIVGMLLGTVIGWGWRNQQLASSIVPYTNVKVVAKLDNLRYKVQPARMAEMNIILCPGSRVDWEVGDQLTDWTFEQKRGCKRTISYHYE